MWVTAVHLACATAFLLLARKAPKAPAERTTMRARGR